MSQTAHQVNQVDQVDGRIRVPCPRCTLPVSLTLPQVTFPGDAERALLRVTAALRLHVAYGCRYS